MRVALWRAIHVQVDDPPPVLDDLVGLALVDPPAGWQDRGDMHPVGTRPFRASIVARARFIEELVVAEAAKGVDQYVILGAGLDTFAQRRPEVAERLQIFEVDEPGPQAWKRRRLVELGYGVPEWLHLVPVDFEPSPTPEAPTTEATPTEATTTREAATDEPWWDAIATAGFDPTRPAVVVSTGVSMYLSKAANAATLTQVARLAPGSSFAMTFLLPAELLDNDADRQGLEMSARGAAASGTPFVSFYSPDEITRAARSAGFKDARHVSGPSYAEPYFAGRSDGMRPSSGEDLLLATT